MQLITKHIYKKEGNLNENDIFLDSINFLEKNCSFSAILEEYYNKIIKIYVGRVSKKLNIYIYYTNVLKNNGINGYIIKTKNLEELRNLLIILYNKIDIEDIDSLIKEIENYFS